VFRGLKLLRTHYRVNGSAILVGSKVTLPTKCPNPVTHPHQIVVSTHEPTGRANSVSVAAKQNYVHGKVNHVVVEEAQEAPGVVIGMFFVSDSSTDVLFDSVASHSFISITYIEKHNLPIAVLRCQMIVSSTGGDMPVRQLCPKVNLKIKG
jgi:hypothetical protein